MIKLNIKLQRGPLRAGADELLRGKRWLTWFGTSINRGKSQIIMKYMLLWKSKKKKASVKLILGEKKRWIRHYAERKNKLLWVISSWKSSFMLKRFLYKVLTNLKWCFIEISKGSLYYVQSMFI